MPNFIRSKSDDARWAKAKEAANKTHSESEGDSYWAIVNSIYQKMTKTDGLEKARQKMSDEYDPNEDPYDSAQEDDELGEGYHEINPDEGDDADKWLQENDPKHDEGEDEYEEYDHDEDEDAHQSGIKEDLGYDDEDPSSNITEAEAQPQSSEVRQKASPQQEVKSGNRFKQPTREELSALRSYTRPWEQRAREAAALKADPTKNPMLARHGNVIEARNQAHGDRNAAYRKFTSSDEYKNADPITQMEMDDNFERDWNSKNPEHLKNALAAHNEAHEKGKDYGGGVGIKGQGAFNAAKDAQIRNILAGGGHGGEGYSLEEGMQHAGGSKGEEGTQATLVQDPASSFAMGNQDFINQYAKDYANKGKKVANLEDMGQYDEGSKRDIGRILGEGPAKDPRFEQFFAHHYPLIGMNARRTLQRLGIDKNHQDVDMSMLHEAGMHGLIQAINDYDHDNPSKASFATHAANKIRGLQMTAMKNQDAIPTEVRQAQKKFASQQSIGKPKVDLHQVIGASQHPKAPDMQDRLQRIGAQRQAHAAVKLRRGPGSSGSQGGGI